ncbi:hypothetical protein LCGC14_1339070 [marine sediment metagenome]|uniref:Methyltransferase type 11 domain-containing protein n=1 Tax=marine sediment metagenome TaxID=412755 RepID=A0A0F9MV52_9ZZZZ
MPSKTWDTKTDWDGAYSIRLERYTGGHPNTRPELRGNYERRAMFNPSIPQLDYVTPEWERIVAHFGWPLETVICIIGCGFGWSIEYLNGRGYADVWGVDPSLYIQGAKEEVDPADNTKRSLVAVKIHDAKLPTPGEVKRFLRDSGHRNGPGGEIPFDVCITERVLSSLTDAEAVTLSAEIRSRDVIKAGGVVAHIESPFSSGKQDSTMNWKSLTEWKALLPNDVIVRTGGEEFL